MIAPFSRTLRLFSRDSEMAMKACYTVVNGEVLSENRDGVKRDYIPDALGNTIALMDSTGAKYNGPKN